MAIKVRDLAKELGVTSEEILEQLNKLYVDADDANSKVDDKIVGLLRIKMGIPEPVKKTKKKEPKAKKEEPKKTTKKAAEKEEKPKKSSSP
ncbi:translation initiation factor IF-2 N-terminal domain-containing protein [Candidatus Omnitrophota bacterium]